MGVGRLQGVCHCNGGRHAHVFRVDDLALKVVNLPADAFKDLQMQGKDSSSSQPEVPAFMQHIVAEVRHAISISSLSEKCWPVLGWMPVVGQCRDSGVRVIMVALVMPWAQYGTLENFMMPLRRKSKEVGVSCFFSCC
jgi:hypothetical protein